MQLVSPAARYKESFLQAIEEYQKIKATDRLYVYALNLEDLKKNFRSHLHQLLDEAIGQNLPKRYVPQTTFWLVDKDEFIGTATIRHRLTDKLLREGGHIGYDIRPSKRKKGYGKKLLALALPKAKELGIDRALITCDENNIGSKKIIEANGGVFENKVEMGKDKPLKLRYWITLH
jgi:predicted acetyltransferase